MKILLTGASGLLGSEIAETFAKKAYKIIKLCNSPREGFLSADLCDEKSFETIDSLQWDLIVHAAALKDPDKCEKDKETTFKVNVSATERLAKLAAGRGAGFIYISTDYVFPGTNAPYLETDAPHPINCYGESKLAGENILRKTLGSACIIRVPILYGLGAGLEKSALLTSSLNALRSEKPWNMEDSIIRYPTWTADVAEAINVLISKKASGIFHYSGQDRTTKYSITEILSDITGSSMKNIVRLPAPPAGETRRPVDSHLDMSKIMALGVKYPLPFRERMKEFYKAGIFNQEK